MTDQVQPKPVNIEGSPQLLKLDLGCGQTPREGFEGVDLYAPNPQHRVDLFKLPFPWADESVAEIHCSHFLEHLPAREVEHRDLSAYPRNPPVFAKVPLPDILGKDFLFAFMDECHRILVPGGTMTIIVPSATSDRAYQDPTHRRFFVQAKFFYFNAEWRKMQGLDHCFRTTSDFAVNVNPIIPAELSVLHPEAQARRFNESRNTVLDWHAVLTKLPLSR